MSNSVTITLPDGRKVRSFSNRRYIAVWLRKARPTVSQRSDRLFILQTAHGGRYVWDPGYCIVDTDTKEVVPGTWSPQTTAIDPNNPPCEGGTS